MASDHRTSKKQILPEATSVWAALYDERAYNMLMKASRTQSLTYDQHIAGLITLSPNSTSEAKLQLVRIVDVELIKTSVLSKELSIYIKNPSEMTLTQRIIKGKLRASRTPRRGSVILSLC